MTAVAKNSSFSDAIARVLGVVLPPKRHLLSHLPCPLSPLPSAPVLSSPRYASVQPCPTPATRHRRLPHLGIFLALNLSTVPYIALFRPVTSQRQDATAMGKGRLAPPTDTIYLAMPTSSGFRAFKAHSPLLPASTALSQVLQLLQRRARATPASTLAAHNLPMFAFFDRPGGPRFDH